MVVRFSMISFCVVLIVAMVCPGLAVEGKTPPPKYIGIRQTAKSGSAKPSARSAAILQAAAKGDAAQVTALLKKDPKLVNACDKDGATPLHHAVAGGHQAIVEFLLSHKANVNARKKDGVTALHVACALGRKEVAEVLITHGADINAKDAKGRTPLSLAQDNGHPAVAQLINSSTLAGQAATNGTSPVGIVLKSADDLSQIRFVGVHPFNEFAKHRSNWDAVFRAYHIQVLDRATALNDVDYKTELDRDTISVTRKLGIIPVSYSTQNPGEFAKDWGFTGKYYAHLPADQRWANAQGVTQSDPYASSGGRDFNGSLLYAEGNVRVRMSICSPHWLDYQKQSIRHALNNGIDAIDVDSPQLGASVWGTGDFSDWSLQAFRGYLQSEYGPEVLQSWGVEQSSSFDYKSYLQRQYTNSAIMNKHGDGQPFFSTSPVDRPLVDPVVRAWVKFNYRSLLDFHRKLNTYAKEYGRTIGKQYVPYFGNLHIGHPWDPFGIANASIVLGQVMDVIQVESAPAAPPLRLTTIYKTALAMGGYAKPVWGLHQPYYGFDGEPKIPIQDGRSYENLLKLYIAETYAAGAVPEIDFGGWPGMPSPRGLFVTQDGAVLPGIRQYLDFVWKHRDLFENVKSQSEVCLIYSIPTFMWHDQPLWGIGYHAEQRPAFVGFARAMEEAHIPYDVAIFGHPDFWDDADALKSLERYKVMVLPLVDCLSDSQIEAIRRFVLAGGRLIMAGDSTGVRDGDYVLRDSPPLERLIRNPGKGIIRFVDMDVLKRYYQHSVSEAHYDPADREMIIHAFGSDRQVLCDDHQTVGVNVVGRPGSTILQIINYDYDCYSDTFTPKRDMRLAVRVTSPDKITDVELLSPETGELVERLPFVAKEGRISFTVPKLAIWDMVVIR